MSTHINDFSTVVLETALGPSVITNNFNGDTVDMIAGDGACFAIQKISFYSDGATLAGHLEQSADGTTWTTITGATFTPVTLGPNQQVIRFTRSARYVRYAVSFTGEGDLEADIAVLIGEQRKTF